MKPFILMILLFAIFLPGVGVTQQDRVLATLEQQQTYDHLTHLLRCVTCPNQTIADSNAPVAESMRAEVLNRVLAGQSEDEIIHYFVQHYGDYVVYQPAFNPKTIVLWLGPLFLVLIGLVLMGLQIKKGKTLQNV